MYRQYENPWELEEELSKLEYELSMAECDDADIDIIVDIKIEIEELKDRINFAWQDEEYDESQRDFADEMWLYETEYWRDSAEQAGWFDENGDWHPYDED